MDYQYVAYTEDRRVVKGKLSADSEEAANELLNYGGYQVVSLKSVASFLNLGKMSLLSTSEVKPKEVIMFSRQMALLLESGIDVVTALELLQNQVTNKSMKGIIGEVAADIRNGHPMSDAMSKHPKVFSKMYHRAIAAGEQGGNIEVVLRRMADHLERSAVMTKKIKGALTYPIVIVIVSILVVALMVTVVLPTFATLYSTIGAELPAIAQLLFDLVDFLTSYGLYLLLLMVAVVGIGFAYIRTPDGKLNWDTLLLRLPIIGRIGVLNELSRCCRTMSLLFKIGLPLPEIMNLVIQGSSNTAMINALTEVQKELIRGEGLSGPMSRKAVFLPLMVQMVAVGEETGNLDNTLTTVADSYEVEAGDRVDVAIGLIQPAITIAIGLMVTLIAMALISAM
ncbi:type II secretion system F family protein, partial [Chloroflexota bacterium]